MVSWEDVDHVDDNCDDDGCHEANLKGNMLLWKWRYEYAIVMLYVFIFLQKWGDRNKKGYYVTWCLNCSLSNSITTYWSKLLEIMVHQKGYGHLLTRKKIDKKFYCNAKFSLFNF